MRVLWWLPLLILVALGAALMVPACGVLPWGINACPVAAPPGQIALAEQRRAELLRIHEGLVATTNLAAQCRIQAPAPEPERAEAAPPVQDATCQPPPAPEVLVLLDVSGSMRWDFDADPALLDQLRALENTPQSTNPFFALRSQAEYAALVARLDQGAGEDRIDLAKRSLVALGRSIPPGTDISLLSFAECGRAPVRAGTFRSDGGDDFERAVRALQIRSQTALAEAIAAVPGETRYGRTADQPVNLVILSDGEDNCGGDPCAAARALKEALPYAAVSVISMAEAANANACIAEGAGGSFFHVTDLDDLTRRLRQGIGALSAEECAALSPQGDPEETGR